MIFFFGERIKSERKPLGQRYCPVCSAQKPFSHVQEKNYFCVFGIRLLPLEEMADYQSCEFCENAFALGELDDKSLPSQVELARSTIAYVLVGYGMQEHLDLAQDVAKKVTGFDLAQDQLLKEVRRFASGQTDFFAQVKQQSAHLNIRGKQQVIEASFLVTHACCEIQYEDRLRLNLIATAMDVSIAFVNATIDQVRQQGCYGVRRLLPTQTQV